MTVNTHPPTQRHSMFLIFQLLLTRFLPNFKGPSWTDYAPQKISAGKKNLKKKFRKKNFFIEKNFAEKRNLLKKISKKKFYRRRKIPKQIFTQKILHQKKFLPKTNSKKAFCKKNKFFGKKMFSSKKNFCQK